jgi:hypothetical protein
MKKEDLTQVKNIGSARMKFLNSQDITTIQQLYEIPLEKLEQVKSLGQHYAKLIKEAVNDIYAKRAEQPKKPVTETSPINGAKIDKTDQKLATELAKTSKYLKTAKEKLKPIQKKKHLKLFTGLKKRSKRLNTRILALSQMKSDLTQKQKKKIIKKAAALNMMLKDAGKNKKGKTMEVLSKEIESFFKFIK